MKNKRTLDALIPKRSAKRDETSKPCFSKKCLMLVINDILKKTKFKFKNFRFQQLINFSFSSALVQ